MDINSFSRSDLLKLAEISGVHAGDGYLRNGGNRWEWDISGSYDEKEYYDNHLIPLFKSVFNIKIEGRYFPHRSTYGFVIRDKKVIKFAHDALKFPYGAKSTIVSASPFVFKNVELMKNFFRGYFDTDGSFSCGKKYGKGIEFKRKYHCYPRVTLVTVSNNLSLDLQRLLNKLDIGYCHYNYMPKPVNENLKYIYNLNGIGNAEKLILLINPKNHTKMSRYLIWKKFGFCPTNISYAQREKVLKDSLDPYSFYKGL